MLNRAAIRSVKAYLPDREKIVRNWGSPPQPALFVNWLGQRFAASGLAREVRQQAMKAGLGDRVTAHVIRHSMATHLLNRGADLETIKELLGHAHIQSTTIYANLSQARIRQVYRRAQPRT